MTEKIRIPIVVDGFGIVETQLDTVAKKLDQVGQSAKRTNESVGSSANSNAIRNASFQISDFVVQVQGGTAASRALAMQLPQLLAGFGTMGAVAGIVAGFAPQIIELFKSGEQVKPFADATKDLADAIGDVASSVAKFDMKGVYEEYNKATAAARIAIVEQIKFRQELLKTEESAARKSFGETLSDTGMPGLFSGRKSATEVLAKDLGITLDAALKLQPALNSLRDGTGDVKAVFEQFGTKLLSGNAQAIKLAKTMNDLAKSERDSAAASTALSEALTKMDKAGATGTIKVDKDKKHVETPLEKLQFEARAADAGIAPQTLKEIEALNEALAKRNIGMTEYLRLAGVAMANDTVIAKNAKAVADQLKEEAQAQALLNDYRANNAVILERIDREAELAAMSDRQRLIAEAMYRAEDEARKLRERIIQQVKDEAAQKQALAVVEAELADQKIRVADAAARSFDQQRTFEFGWRKAFQAYSDNASNAASSAQEVFQQASSAMEDALTRFAMTGKLSFSSLANSIIADIVRMQARAATSGIMGSLGNWVGSFFGNGSSSTGLASLPASVNSSFPANHSGGIVGTEATFYRSISRAAFDNAPKYHTGGIAGDEVPSILKRGEGVFTQAQMKALAPAGSGGNVSVNVTVVGDAKVKQAERPDGRGGKIIDILIEQVEAKIAGNISTGNGPVPTALQSSYGLNRTAGAY